MQIKTEPPNRPSSLIAEVGHQNETLAVKFHNGDIWHYSPVSEREFKALEEGGGQYFHKHIKGKKDAVRQ